MTLRTIRHNRPIRGAFTLVELLVAMALSIFIMWLLAESFQAGPRLHAARALDRLDDVAARRRAGGHRPRPARRALLPDARHSESRRAPERSSVRQVGQLWAGIRATRSGRRRRAGSSASSARHTGHRAFRSRRLLDEHGRESRVALHVDSARERTAALQRERLRPAGSRRIESRAAEIGLFLVDSGKRTTPGPIGPAALLPHPPATARRDDDRRRVHAVTRGRG